MFTKTTACPLPLETIPVAEVNGALRSGLIVRRRSAIAKSRNDLQAAGREIQSFYEKKD
jgi:hypothetical protein